MRPSPQSHRNPIRERATASAQEDELSRARRGDRQAFERLVGPHLGRALGLAGRLLGNRDDAEDAVQDALLKTHAHLGELRRLEGFGTWFLSIVYRQALDAMRRRGTRLRHEQAQRHALEPSAAETSAGRDTLRRVREVLEELPAKQRAALHLRVFEELSHDEIAAVLGLTPASVRVYVVKARQHLRERLGKELLP